MNEESIKTHLIDFLLNEQDFDAILISEFSFADRKRRADLVKIDANSLTSYEIKSAQDNLLKLASQIIEYNSCFDYSYIVVDKKHIKEASKIITNSVGILIFEDNRIILSRPAKKRVRLNKISLLSTLNKKELSIIISQENLKKINHQLPKDEIVIHLSNSLVLGKIKKEVREILLDKYKPRFIHFLNERGKITTKDDLLLLTRNQDELLL